MELCDQISSGKRQWADTTTLIETGRSLPAGLLQDWPLGSPITLHTLAAMMISRSDNTAADHLMLTLGRDALEGQLKKLPVFEPERNRPFLRTSELFKIKLIAPESLASSYPKLSEAEKRQTLQQLDAMDQIDELQRVVAAYEQRAGRQASGWDDLRLAGYMRGSPIDPTGAPYQLQAGTVSLAPQSRLNPLPAAGVQIMAPR
jgi:beta-lactamase class A